MVYPFLRSVSLGFDCFYSETIVCIWTLLNYNFHRCKGLDYTKVELPCILHNIAL